MFQTSTDLKSEWQADYAVMLAGHADQLTALQRMEGNAEAVIENTGAARLATASQVALRSDLQREYDGIYAAMQIDQATLGIDPNAQFNTYTYLKMEQTLQGNEQLETLATQGHGLNSPPSVAYDGYTTDFQNKTDGKTFYVGGGLDNGENAISAFLDDVALTHAPFAMVEHNGVLTQVNQNGGLEDSLTDAVTAANETTFDRVFVASDFSTNAAALGAVVLVPNPVAAPPLPPPATPLNGVTALDGTILPESITGLTAHAWTADATGLYTTLADLATEWKSDYAQMLAGLAGNLTPLQRMEGNAEAVIEHTNASKLSVSSQTAFRMDAQREFDAIDAAMRIDQTMYGIDPAVAFTTYSYLKLSETLQGNETLKELGIQGHGLNTPPATKYDGFTTDFQNRTDGTTFYVGGGPGNGELAIPSFFDDDVLTHAPFPIVEHNGVVTTLNQNGNIESPLNSDALVAANNTAFDRVYVASDFNTDSAAVGEVVNVPPAVTPPVFAAFDTSTNTPIILPATPYSGPVALLEWQYADITTDSVNITATAPNSFIHSGSGNDAIDVSGVGGTNVLDGGTGSNFLVGGKGPGSADTFYLDDRAPASPIWTTVANFHAGDWATVFGLTPTGTTNVWVDGQGAAGYTGLTLNASALGSPTVSLTLAGYSSADMANGRLSVGFSSEADGTPYLYVYGNS